MLYLQTKVSTALPRSETSLTGVTLMKRRSSAPRGMSCLQPGCACLDTSGLNEGNCNMATSATSYIVETCAPPYSVSWQWIFSIRK